MQGHFAAVLEIVDTQGVSYSYAMHGDLLVYSSTVVYAGRPTDLAYATLPRRPCDFSNDTATNM